MLLNFFSLYFDAPAVDDAIRAAENAESAIFCNGGKVIGFQILYADIVSSNSQSSPFSQGYAYSGERRICIALVCSVDSPHSNVAERLRHAV